MPIEVSQETTSMWIICDNSFNNRIFKKKSFVIGILSALRKTLKLFLKKKYIKHLSCSLDFTLCDIIEDSICDK